MKTRRATLIAIVTIAATTVVPAAESDQPDSHVTRGIYADISAAMQGSVWSSWGDGFTYVDEGAHGGRSCVRCVGKADARGQGVGQTIKLDQKTPKPVKIAGWSKSEGVPGPQDYHYSLYVDFSLADGTSWPMKLATFPTGTHDWQYAETVVTPPQPIRSARFHAFLRERDGTIWFDDLFFGEAEGPNRLKCSGFEMDERVDLAARARLFADLEQLHCNALHSYLSGSLEVWDQPVSEQTAVGDFLRAARDHRIGVWLTLGMGHLPIRDTADPNFPQFDCVNNRWGQRWTEALAKAARYPLAGLSMVPDEYNWNTHHVKEAFAKHPDAKVRDFYQKLGSYCDCERCRERFRAKFSEPFPDRLPGTLPSADASYRHWLHFRYDSTTDWIRRSCAAVKQANPAIRTDSLICVTPICSDFWYGPGLAWDRLGYEAGLEYATTDPYIQLHNYLGDSTHWYVTETTEHLAAAGPSRRCGIVLEASRLRPEHREIDPVEIYGSALTAVWHGADELAWWHHSHVMDTSHTTDRAEVSQACVRGVYGLLEKIDPWLEGLRPQPGVAVLFSRASCDLWRLYLQAKGAPLPFDARGITDPRHAAIVQKEVLYLLLRTGVPTTLYYLESVGKAELAPHAVILVPLPLAIGREQVQLLASLADDGKQVVICGEAGSLDEDGTPYDRPALDGLLKHRRVSFVSAAALDRLASQRENEKRTRKERILPAAVDAAAAGELLAAIASGPQAAAVRPLMTGRLPEGDDFELCLATNARGERLFLAINWDSAPRSVGIAEGRGLETVAAEAYHLSPDGNWQPWARALGPELRLGPQEAVVARLKGNN
ncbi:MAG: hypothetical protein GX575_11895 [Candidatus Anammoximicrobium sp.]|mgnify:CR=1 FL=1|nr:hypothetical protein [Candidatus Anammoximicrobium sp.]